MHRCFRVAPPAVHLMLLTLENTGLISSTLGAARTIAIEMH